MKTPTTGEIRPNSTPSLSENESPDERGPILKLVVNTPKPAAETAAQPLTMDAVMALVATAGKGYAFAAAKESIRQGDEVFIHQVIAYAVTFCECTEDMIRRLEEDEKRAAQIVRLVPGGQREDKEG